MYMMPAPQDTQQNQGQQPSLPPGWEAVYSNDAKRHYFIDHINKKTQWEDPRLTHSFIWGEEENAMLRHLSESFAGRVPENVIRDALLRSGFQVDAAVSELEAWNKRKSLSPRDSERRNIGSAQGENRGSKRSSPAAGPKTNSERPASGPVGGVDDFAYLFVKSKFSEVPDSVIQDILTNFNNDEEKAVKELKAMGFAGGKRQTATSRIEHREMNKEEKAKLKLTRFQDAVTQLSSEFSTCSAEEIRNILTDTDCDFTESRSLLRQIEAKKKMEGFLSAMQSGKETAGSSLNADNEHAEGSGTRNDENNRGVAFEHQATEETLTVQEHVTVPVVCPKIVLEDKSSRQPMGNAKGPDRSLRCGPNKEMLSKRTKSASGHNQTLSTGPICLNRKGPDASLLQQAPFKLCQSR